MSVNLDKHPKKLMDLDTRVRIIKLFQNGRTPLQIALGMGIAEKTAYKWIHRWRAEGPAGLHDRRRSGCPRVTTQDQDRLIVASASAAPTTPSTDQLAALGIGISDKTYRSRLKEAAIRERRAQELAGVLHVEVLRTDDQQADDQQADDHQADEQQASTSLEPIVKIEEGAEAVDLPAHVRFSADDDDAMEDSAPEPLPSTSRACAPLPKKPRQPQLKVHMSPAPRKPQPEPQIQASWELLDPPSPTATEPLKRNATLTSALKLCRLCTKPSYCRVALFDEAQSASIREMIHAVIGIKVVDSCLLPRHICIRCNHQIVEWFNFKKTCYSSENNFRLIAVEVASDTILHASGKQKRKSDDIDPDLEIFKRSYHFSEPDNHGPPSSHFVSCATEEPSDISFDEEFDVKPEVSELGILPQDDTLMKDIEFKPVISDWQLRQSAVPVGDPVRAVEYKPVSSVVPCAPGLAVNNVVLVSKSCDSRTEPDNPGSTVELDPSSGCFTIMSSESDSTVQTVKEPGEISLESASSSDPLASDGTL